MENCSASRRDIETIALAKRRKERKYFRDAPYFISRYSTLSRNPTDEERDRLSRKFSRTDFSRSFDVRQPRAPSPIRTCQLIAFPADTMCRYRVSVTVLIKIWLPVEQVLSMNIFSSPQIHLHVESNYRRRRIDPKAPTEVDCASAGDGAEQTFGGSSEDRGCWEARGARDEKPTGAFPFYLPSSIIGTPLFAFIPPFGELRAATTLSRKKSLVPSAPSRAAP